MIDLILIGIVANIIALPFHSGYYSGPGFGINTVLTLVYFVYFWTQQNGRTLGNMALGIRVQRTDGSPIDIGRAVVRWLLIVEIPIVNIVSGLVAAFTANKQGLHDMAADTNVVRVS